MKKKIIISTVAVLIVVSGYFLWPRKSAEKPVMPGLQQRTATVSRGDLSALVSATGKVEPIQKVEVKSKASGQIMAMPVEESDRVQKGALIARIDETDARNVYEQAVADLEVAKATVAQTASNVRRQEELFKRGLISQAEMDQVKLDEVRAKSQLIKAETELSTMETRLKDSVVRSPITGIILQKNVEAGQIIASGINSVSGGTLIATVAEMDSVYVYAEVDEVDIGQVQIGQTARVVPDAFPDEVFHGSVLRVAPLAKVEQNVTTFNVTVVVPNRDGKLKAGMNTTVDLTVADRRDVLLVAKEAIKDIREIRAQMMAMNMGDGLTNEPSRARSDSAHGGMRQRWNANAGGGTGEGWRVVSPGGHASPANGAVSRKFVLVKKGEVYEPRPVDIGASNFDFAEVVKGLQEGETVLVFSGSRAAVDRQAFMNRMRTMSGFSGFGGTQSSGSGQRPGTGR